MTANLRSNTVYNVLYFVLNCCIYKNNTSVKKRKGMRKKFSVEFGIDFHNFRCSNQNDSFPSIKHVYGYSSVGFVSEFRKFL